MHSGTMRTNRLLTISSSIQGGGRVYLEGVCPGDVCQDGVSPQVGGCLPKGCLPKGVCLPGGVCLGKVSALLDAGIHTTPPVNRMTDRCKNITLP